MPATERESTILAAATALLEEGASFKTLEVEAIAERAGLATTNFYFHFRDKRDLLLALAAEAADDLTKHARRWWTVDKDETSGPPQGQIEPIVRTFVEHGAVLSAVVEGAAIDSEVRVAWNGIVGAFVEATRARIEAEVEAGRAVDGVSPGETAFALVWMIERACYQHFRGDAGDPGELAAALTAIWQRSIYTA